MSHPQTAQKKYVAYYRVSTKSQEISGLGLADQKYQVESYVGKDKIVKEFVEVESGLKKKRYQLDRAVGLCRLEGFTLVVACLDRLGRNASQLHNIKENIDLLCVDRPNMSTLEFSVVAGMAQAEAERISERTKAALEEKKRQGFKLGNPQHLTKDAILKSARLRKKRAIYSEENKRAYSLIKLLREKNLSYRKIAVELNSSGYRTSKGNTFSGKTVHQLEKMYEKYEENVRFNFERMGNTQ